MPVTRRQFNQLSVLGAAGMLASAPAGAGGLADLYHRSDATALAAAVRSGAVTPLELLEEAIRRSERLNPRLNAVTQKHYDYGRRAIAAGLPDGPFTGVPFLLKDLGVTLAGTVTSAGSRLHARTLARESSELVRRYQRAGLVIFGKTNTPEYGLALTTENRAFGDCLNPWNTAHSTGGSSGGAAAAVAAGILPVAHGTDGGGSIRVPAAHCGLFGFKPSRGLTPGVTGAGMSIGHVLSLSVRDSAGLLDATAAYQPGAPYGPPGIRGGYRDAAARDPQPLRVALNLSTPAVTLHPDCRRAVESAASLLEQLGHRVEEAAPAVDYARLNAVQNTLIATDVATSLRALEQARGEPIAAGDIEPMTAMVREAAAGFSQYDYSAALRDMHAIGRSIGRFLLDHDLILQPVTATPAPPLGSIIYRDGDDLERYTRRFKQVSAFTHQYNMSGQPSMSLPLAMSADGLPVGVMLSGRVGEDALLLSLAGQIERATPWRDRRPPVHAASLTGGRHDA